MSVSTKTFSNDFYRGYAKRWLDFLLAIVALVFASPVLIVVFLLLSIANGRAGALFFQSRPGRGGELFRIVKFKTMNDKCDADGVLLPDSERLTSVGRFVRTTSIDELPQLWNVLCGDMSLVGPRPLLPMYLPLYNEEQFRRHEVRPGITGWAQCHGRNAITWTQKFKYDVWYVDHLSFWLDVKIIFITIRKVLVREGINEAGQATMEAFNGSN